MNRAHSNNFELWALLTSLVAASSAASAQSVVDFRTAVAYSVAQQPNSLVLHDLDLNGHLDVAAAGFNVGEITILLGDGSGALSDAGNATAVGTPLGIAAGRFDADALPDLVFSQGESDFMWLLRNSGGGMFEAPKRIMGGHDPWPVVAVDFNNDGKLDVVQALSPEAGGRVNILYGNGDGTFAAPVGTRTGGANRGLAIADFDGDQRLDAVVSNLSRGTVSVLLGREDGTLAPHLESDAGNQPAGVAAGDLNEDGIVDVVASSTVGDAVTASLGIGDGRFLPSTTYPVGDAPVGIALADLDKDDHLDIVAGNRGSGTVSVLYGDGEGGFGPARAYIADRSPLALAIGDLNEDTVPDVVTVNGGEQQQSTAIVFLGNGATLDAVEQLTSPAPSTALAVGDMDGDAAADIVAALPAADALAIYLRREDRFDLTSIDFDPIRPSTLALADLDGDDRVDVIVASEGGSNLAILMNRGDSFAEPVTLPVGGVVVAIVASDYDDDGTIDIATALASSEVVVLRGNGAGGFATPERIGLSGIPVAMTRADFDSKGGADVAVALESGFVALLLGRADEGLELLGDVGVSIFPVALTALDFNDDDYDDLAVVHGPGVLQLLIGDGDGGFDPGATFNGLEFPTSIAARDVTGDGHADLLISERTRDSVAVLAASGAASFATPVRIRVGDAPRAVQSGDLDGDGGYDLATSCVQLSVAFNRRSYALRGDANGDTRVAAADLIAIVAAVPEVDCTPAERHAALGTDADGDGVVCRRDLRAGVQRIFRGS